MRLVLFDLDSTWRTGFLPLAHSRPIWDLRCGMTSLGEKLLAAAGARDAAYFLPDYLAPFYLAQHPHAHVNDASVLADPQDLLLLNARLKASAVEQIDRRGPSEIGLGAMGEALYVWVRRAEHTRLEPTSLATLLESARHNLPARHVSLPTWDHTWDLVLANPQQLLLDFGAAGASGIHGSVEEPRALRGNARDLFVAPGAVVHPMVVIDLTRGPVYLDEGVEVHPFTRIEGPCYVGRNSTLLGAKCREGNSIGPFCRVGGEVEESIIHGYSNKYHDGFLGHSYVGEWVNLGALTTNSDLKNDYGDVEVVLDGHTPTRTGSIKVGALIGDHTKTSIGTLLNSGAYVGAMSLLIATGKPLPKYIPDFSWLLDGHVTKGFGKAKLYETARTAKGRRKCDWTPAEQAMWDAVFERTAAQRDELIRRGRRYLAHA